MANNYLEFSAVLPHLTSEQEAWLKEQLETVYVFGERQYTEEELPEGINAPEADWYGIRAWADLDPRPDYGDEFGFCCQFCDEDPDEDWGRHLWFYTDEWGHPELVAHLVQKFLRKFRPNDTWSLGYAVTCSKSRAGEFGGGAVFVTADEIQYFSDGDFLEKARQAFERVKRPDRKPTTERRFVLYDFDTGDLASARVYGNAREAAEDADPLGNVMVVGFALEHVAAGSRTEKTVEGD